MSPLLKYLILLNIFIFNKSAPFNKDEAMVFLNKFGFIQNNTLPEMSKTEVEIAVKEFQKNYKIPETGELDTETLMQMEQPRCGRPDGQEISNNLSIWSKNVLTYNLINEPISGELHKSQVKSELKEAFQIWAKYIPVTFEYKKYNADIEIRFINPNNNENSDGNGKTLAYAYYPENGDIYFDNEYWTYKSSKGYNLRLVAAHEIGHSLGLKHSEIKNTLMFPIYSPYKGNFTLHENDISRIQALYNRKYLCKFGKIDGIFEQDERTIIAVKGQYCWKFENNKLKSNYPKLCHEIWNNFPTKLDAVFKIDKKMHFFINNKLMSYQNEELIEVNFSDKSIKKIDTVLRIHNRLYIFEGSKYWTYISKENTWISKSQTSKSISSFWKGIPANIDAVFYDNKKYIYFFKGTAVYKFDIDQKNTVNSEILINEYFQC